MNGRLGIEREWKKLPLLSNCAGVRTVIVRKRFPVFHKVTRTAERCSTSLGLKSGYMLVIESRGHSSSRDISISRPERSTLPNVQNHAQRSEELGIPISVEFPKRSSFRIA